MKKSIGNLPRIALALARRCRCWRRNEAGSAAIEFAIIAPVFFFLMFVIAETALVFIAEQVLDNAVFETARLIRTGQAQGPPLGPMAEADFKSQVCNRVSVFINCSGANFYLDVETFSDLDDPDFATALASSPVDDNGDFEDADYGIGGAGDIVVVRAFYQWPTNTIFGGLSLKNLSNGKRLIGSFSAFRNEPFQTTAAN